MAEKQNAGQGQGTAAGTATAPAKDKDISWTVTMVLEKETKNAIRYNETEVEGQAPKIGQLYVQKHALPNKPEKITVHISAV